MNWNKIRFCALLFVLSICVIAAGWGMSLKGSRKQASDRFKVIPYSIQDRVGWMAEIPSSSYYYQEPNEPEDDQKEHNHPEHNHPFSISYYDQEPNEPKIEHPKNEHPKNEHPDDGFPPSAFYDIQEPNEPKIEFPKSEHPGIVSYRNSEE